MRVRPLSWLLRRLLALGLLAVPLAAPAQEDAQHHFYPSLIDSNTGGKLDLEDFTPAKQCGECHPTMYRHWKVSMHARAFDDPLFQAVWIEAKNAAGPEMERLCAGCHSAIGTLTEFVWVRESGQIIADNIAGEGVTCDLCHSVVAVKLLRQGEITGNAGLILDPTGPKRGPSNDASQVFHATAESKLHRSADLCGACHNVFHPTSHTRVARTHLEWQQSIYAENDITCQDCHMVPPELVPGIARSLKKPTLPGATSVFETFRTPFYPHTFSGANVAIPELLGNDDHAADARTLLQQAASVTIADVRMDAGDGTLGFAVTVRNEHAGHNLPTGMNEIRQMWLDVQVFRGDDPEPVWHSGGVDEAGRVDPAATMFRALAVDSAGRPTWKPWEVDRIAEDTSIPAKRSVTTRYTVPLADATGPLRVEATLRYRSFSQQIADDYLKREDYRVPVVPMASARATVER
jgi:hypothetical protein